MDKVLLSLVFFIFFASIANSRKHCASRDYGKGSVVCVCNYTYCDDLDPIVKQPKDTVVLFQSGKSGDRFKESKLKFLSVHSNQTNVNITIDRTKKLQKIFGFGGAFTDAAGININSLPINMAANIMKDYFSVNGLEYSVGRIPMAGTDFSERTYSYDDIENDEELKHFALAKEDLYHKVPLIQLAQHLSPRKLKLFGSPWSSPTWMKTNHKFNGKGQLIGKPGEKYYQIWANYFVKFIEAYKANGIDVWGVTIENEPGAGFTDYKFNCLAFSAEMERDFIKLNLGPTLEKAGLKDKVKIMIHDDQRSSLVNWTHTVLSDKEAAKYVSGIAFHWYHNSFAPVEILDEVAAAFPDYFILNTEACIETKNPKKEVLSLGEWEQGERYANDIITDLDHHASGWIDWNMALDLHGGPNWVNNWCNSPIIVNASAMEYYKQPMFYVMGHFSKFLTPDSVKVGLTKVGNYKFEAVAFERPDGASVLIAFNNNTHPISLNIAEQGSGHVRTNLPANSIQSYIWWH